MTDFTEIEKRRLPQELLRALDIRNPAAILVQKSKDGLWVTVDGVTVLRIQGITLYEYEDPDLQLLTIDEIEAGNNEASPLDNDG